MNKKDSRFGVSYDTSLMIAEKDDDNKTVFFPSYDKYVEMAQIELANFVSKYSEKELEHIDLDFTPFHFSLHELISSRHDEISKDVHALLDEINRKALELSRSES